jgi:hypothetical protein
MKFLKFLVKSEIFKISGGTEIFKIFVRTKISKIFDGYEI